MDRLKHCYILSNISVKGDLHSSMDRLKLKKYTNIVKDVSYLHSSMDRLKPELQKYKWRGLYKFTFQYG